MPERALVLFTKPPIPGRVKTRLIGDLTAEQAAQLHEAFQDDLLAALKGGSFDLRLAWALDGGEELPRGPVPGLRQEGSDLGERLYEALAAVSREYRWVAAVGTDHPELTRQTVEEALDRLEKGADIVLGPAEDGGFYLVAVRGDRLAPALFEGIPWSTAEVLQVMRERCRRLGMRTTFLERLRDVDTPLDLANLVRSLEAGRHDCPRSRSLLVQWGRLAP